MGRELRKSGFQIQWDWENLLAGRGLYRLAYKDGECVGWYAKNPSGIIFLGYTYHGCNISEETQQFEEIGMKYGRPYLRGQALFDFLGIKTTS